MCNYCKIDPYKNIEEYKPNINYDGLNKENYTEELTERVYGIALIIKDNDHFYVNSKGDFKGIAWWNLLARFLLFIFSWKIKGKSNQLNVEKKITEVFNFILNISTKYSIPVQDNMDTVFNNTHFTYLERDSHKLCAYTILAEKIIKKYPKDRYPELFELAHRIIHERPLYIQNNGCEKDNKNFIAKSPNIRENVKDTVYQKTTVWNAP